VAAAPGTRTLPGVIAVQDLFTTTGNTSLGNSRPQVSAASGYSGVKSAHTSQSNEIPIHLVLSNNKLEGSRTVTSGINAPAVHEKPTMQSSAVRISDSKGKNRDAYVVPSNTTLPTTTFDTHRPEFRPMATAQSKYRGSFAQGAIPRAGISTPQIHMGMRKDS
jgi:Ulp1 family protease